MAYNSKKYNRINWKNRPSTLTALGATNLNKMDVFLNEVDNALILMDSEKLGIKTANSMLKSVTYDNETGIWIFTQLNGETFTFDQGIEKIPVSFELSSDGILTMTTEDGTEYSVNIVELIKQYNFEASDTIYFEKDFRDDSFHVVAHVKEGSIQGEHLDPDYRSDILTLLNQAQEAESSALQYAKDAKSWAVGDTGVREDENVNNSEYWSNESKRQAETAKNEADRASQYSQIVAPGFYVDEETMVLYIKSGVGIEFGVYDGVLAWKIA